MNFQPTEDRIAIELIDTSVTDSGLKIVRHDLREEMLEAKVLATGPGCHYVQPGNTILLPRYSTLELDVEGQSLTITRESEVIAITN